MEFEEDDAVGLLAGGEVAQEFEFGAEGVEDWVGLFGGSGVED